MDGLKELFFGGGGGETPCFQGSHFVCVGKGRVVVMVVCGGGSVGGSVGVLITFVYRSLGVGMFLLGGGGCIGMNVGVCFRGMGGWVSEFWTSSIVYICYYSL